LFFKQSNQLHLILIWNKTIDHLVKIRFIVQEQTYAIIHFKEVEQTTVDPLVQETADHDN